MTSYWRSSVVLLKSGGNHDRRGRYGFGILGKTKYNTITTVTVATTTTTITTATYLALGLLHAGLARKGLAQRKTQPHHRVRIGAVACGHATTHSTGNFY